MALLLLAGAAGPVVAEPVSPTPPPSGGTAAEKPEPEEAPASAKSLRWGADLYLGLSTLPGTRRYIDGSGAFGNFHSFVPSLEYRLSEVVAIETAWTATSERKLGWLQLHITYE